MYCCDKRSIKYIPLLSGNDIKIIKHSQKKPKGENYSLSWNEPGGSTIS